MNTTIIPLHVIIKDLANTKWSTLPEHLLRTTHNSIYDINSTEPRLKTLTIPILFKTAGGKFTSLEVTYQYEDVGLSKPTLIIDEVFHLGVNISEFLSDKAIEDIASEAEAFLLNESISSEILAKAGV